MARRKTSRAKRLSGAVRGSIRGTGAALHLGVHESFHEMRQAASHTGSAALWAGVTPLAAGAGAAVGAKRGYKHPSSPSYKLRPDKRQNRYYSHSFGKGPR